MVFISLAVFSPLTALIAMAAAALSFLCLLMISHYSAKNAPVEAAANRDMTGAILEYARGLAVVKSFGKSGASMDAVKKAVGDSRRIHLEDRMGLSAGQRAASAGAEMRQRGSGAGRQPDVPEGQHGFLRDAGVPVFLLQHFCQP